MPNFKYKLVLSTNPVDTAIPKFNSHPGVKLIGDNITLSVTHSSLLSKGGWRYMQFNYDSNLE